MRKAVALLKAGEEELFLQQHPLPKKCKSNKKQVFLYPIWFSIERLKLTSLPRYTHL